jgi:zona occludens toxin
MINAIVGRTRSGKSYEAVRYWAIEALKNNRMVVTNLSLNADRICAAYGEHLRDLIVVVKSDFSDFSGKPTDHYFSMPDHFIQHTWKDSDNKGPLFIIDEAHFVFGEGCTPDIKKFLAMHGHYGFDILLLTQDVSQLDRVVRKMPDIAIRTVKLNIVGNDKQYKRKVYSSCTFRNSDFIEESTRDYDPAYFGFYSSHTLSKDSVKEVKVDDLKGGGFMPNKKNIFFILGFGVLLTIFALKSLFTSPEEKAIDVSTPESSPVTTTAPTQSNTPDLIVPESELITPHEKSNPVPILDEREENTNHPFQKVSLHIVGRSNIRGNGRVIDIIQISASKNNNVMFLLDSNDLFRSGYDVEVYSDCSARITYDLYEEFIVCDSPDKIGNGQGTIAQTFSPQ